MFRSKRVVGCTFLFSFFLLYVIFIRYTFFESMIHLCICAGWSFYLWSYNFYTDERGVYLFVYPYTNVILNGDKPYKTNQLCDFICGGMFQSTEIMLCFQFDGEEKMSYTFSLYFLLINISVPNPK